MDLLLGTLKKETIPMTREQDGDKVIIRHNPIQQGTLVSIVVFLLSQAGVLIWCLSGISTTINWIRSDVMTIKSNVISEADHWYAGQKADAALQSQLDALRAEFNDVKERGTPVLEKRVTAIEYQLGRK
jgi:hypothetical protein